MPAGSHEFKGVVRGTVKSHRRSVLLGVLTLQIRCVSMNLHRAGGD